MDKNITQKERELLLKDLCARLPYGVLCMVHDDEINEPVELLSINPKWDKPLEIDDGYDENSSTYWNLEDVKPYLRSMSSMTEEELKMFKQLQVEADEAGTFEGDMLLYDWLNKNHFDYRLLIFQGLALEAPEDMYSI